MYKCLKWHFYSSRNTNEPNNSKIHAEIQKKWPRQTQLMTILSFDLQVCHWPLTFPLLLLQENTCAKLFLNPQINVESMAPFYDHLINGPSRVTLTFNIPKQMFQMALLSSRRTNVQNYFEIHT